MANEFVDSSLTPHSVSYTVLDWTFPVLLQEYDRLAFIVAMDTENLSSSGPNWHCSSSFMELCSMRCHLKPGNFRLAKEQKKIFHDRVHEGLRENLLSMMLEQWHPRTDWLEHLPAMNLYILRVVLFELQLQIYEQSTTPSTVSYRCMYERGTLAEDTRLLISNRGMRFRGQISQGDVASKSGWGLICTKVHCSQVVVTCSSDFPSWGPPWKSEILTWAQLTTSHLHPSYM